MSTLHIRHVFNHVSHNKMVRRIGAKLDSIFSLYGCVSGDLYRTWCSARAMTYQVRINTPGIPGTTGECTLCMCCVQMYVRVNAFGFVASARQLCSQEFR